MSLQQNNNRRDARFKSEEEESAFRRRWVRAVGNYRDGKSKSSAKDQEGLEQTCSFFSVENLEKLVAERKHSVTAKRFLESARCMDRGIDALRQGDNKLAASNLAEAYRRNMELMMRCSWEIPLMELAKLSMKKVFKDTSQEDKTRAEALFVHANILAWYNGQKQQALKQCRLAHILLPQDPYILAAEGHILQSLKDSHASLKTFQKAALLCGDADPEISLFYTAMALLFTAEANSIKVTKEAISLLEKYVHCALPDAPRLPSAYYYLAWKHMVQGPSYVATAKRYFAMAEQAEKKGLPFNFEILFPQIALLKESVRLLLKNYIACGNEKCSAAATHPCGLCEQAYYCSEECLHTDWPSHKAFCKKHRKAKKPTTS